MAAALIFQDLPQDCRVCRRPFESATRRQWGCEEEKEGAAYAYECLLCADDNPTGACPQCDGTDPECDGCGGVEHHPCPLCGGVGSWESLTCPQREARLESRHMVAAIAATEAGLLPVAGGLRDQTRSFAACLGYVLDAKRRIEKAKTPKGRRRG